MSNSCFSTCCNGPRRRLCSRYPSGAATEAAARCVCVRACVGVRVRARLRFGVGVRACVRVLARSPPAHARTCRTHAHACLQHTHARAARARTCPNKLRFRARAEECMLRVRMSVCGTRGRRGGGVACVRAWCVQLPRPAAGTGAAAAPAGTPAADNSGLPPPPHPPPLLRSRPGRLLLGGRLCVEIHGLTTLDNLGEVGCDGHAVNRRLRRGHTGAWHAVYACPARQDLWPGFDGNGGGCRIRPRAHSPPLPMGLPFSPAFIPPAVGWW